MSHGVYVPLQDGVNPTRPDVAKLVSEIAALKPETPKLTVREQLVRVLRAAYCKAYGIADNEHPHGIGYLAEADAAIAFFRTLLDSVGGDLEDALSGSHDRSEGMRAALDSIEKALSK